jgi:hypothetical protein
MIYKITDTNLNETYEFNSFKQACERAWYRIWGEKDITLNFIKDSFKNTIYFKLKNIIFYAKEEAEDFEDLFDDDFILGKDLSNT